VGAAREHDHATNSGPETQNSTAVGLESDNKPSRSGYARKALAASVVGYAMDGFDMLILGFMLPEISDELQLTGGQAGSLVTWTLLGALVGGVVFGHLSDRFGRMKVLSWSIMLFAVFTGLCALAQGYGSLLVFRTICGLGLGGEFGIGMALAAETWPANQRARVSSYVALGWQAGVLLAALVTPMLLPFIGWRGMFAVGVLPAVVSFLLRRVMEEPEIFVQHAAATQSAIPLKLLVKDLATVRVSVGVCILCSVQNFGYFGLMIWLPTYLSAQLHFGLTKSAIWTVATILGMGCGIWVFGQLADRIGRRPAFFIFQSGAAIMVVIYSQLTNATALLIAGACMGVFVNGMLGGLGALISELYPTAARATAQNVLFNVGRAVGGLGPLVVGSVASRYSFPAAIGMLATIYVIDIFATAVLIPETKGVELQ
jgi:MFS family permease